MIRILRNELLDELWEKLQIESCFFSKRDLTESIVNEGMRLFFRDVFDSIQLVPVFILRGGFMMIESFRKYEKNKPMGMVGARRKGMNDVDFYMWEIPRLCDGESFIILDLIANTGSTLSTLMSKLEVCSNLDVSKASVCVFTIFSSSDSLFRLAREHPSCQIYTIYTGLKRNEKGWLCGVDFDGGDLAFGKSEFR